MFNHNDAMVRLMADQLAERHRTPKSTVTHPKGVIVPDDQLLTDNIRNDPDYVPYCGPCSPMQRMRRVEDGFICPTCKNHTNWDLTPFNGNVDVQFDPQYADPTFLAKHEAEVKLIREHETAHKETYAVYKAAKDAQAQLDWNEDRSKKNASDHDCNKCKQTFFGKRSRKYCRQCQVKITQVVKQNTAAASNPFHVSSRQERRHG